MFLIDSLSLSQLVKQVQLQREFSQESVYQRHAADGAEGILLGARMWRGQRNREIAYQRKFGPIYDQVLGILGFWDPAGHTSPLHFHLYKTEARRVLEELDGNFRSKEDIRDVVERVFEEGIAQGLQGKKHYDQIAEDIWDATRE